VSDVLPYAIMVFRSPRDPKREYTLRYYRDGVLQCSCPGFTHRGTCYHLDLPSSQDFAAYYAKQAEEDAQAYLDEGQH